MTLPRPYNLTDEELHAHGDDIDSVIESRYREAIEAAKREPIVFEWFKGSRGWGQIWAEARDGQVYAGLGGCMAGVKVASDLPSEAARNFAHDFEAGRVFALTESGARQWLALVESAWQAKKAGLDRESLRSKARESGILPDGSEIDRDGLRAIYEAGQTIKQ